MAVFHFRYCGGLSGVDEPFDVELKDVAEAKVEAVMLLAELIKAHPHQLIYARDGCITVADEQHLDLFRIDVGLFLTSAISPPMATAKLPLPPIGR